MFHMTEELLYGRDRGAFSGRRGGYGSDVCILASSLSLSSLELSDTKLYEPYIRARLGTAAHFWE